MWESREVEILEEILVHRLLALKPLNFLKYKVAILPQWRALGCQDLSVCFQWEPRLCWVLYQEARAPKQAPNEKCTLL